MTTPGDAVGPSAKSAVAPVPTPETDADPQVTEVSPGAERAGVGAAAPTRGRSGSTPAPSSGGTGTASPAGPGDDAGAGVADDEPTTVNVSTAPGESPGPSEDADAAEERTAVSAAPTAEPAKPAAVPAKPTTERTAEATEPVAVPVAGGPLPEPDTSVPTTGQASEEPATEPVPTDAPPTVPAKEGPAKEGPAKEGPAEEGPAEEGPAADAGPGTPGDSGNSDPAGDPATVATPPSGPARDLVVALDRLRAAIGGTAYPLVMPSAEDARRMGAALVAQLDDYVLPRLARLDAPLLVVIGGSTGAGKSTLVNSLVRQPISAAGVLRPTTRSPVLVCHPSDTSWFRKGDLLPGLTRTTEPGNDPKALQLVAVEALGPGLAFLDAPDIDSIVDANRALASQLLAAADLWLFVTTAARYADAVPWELLRTARFRGTVIALVLDRVPPEAAGDISAHLAEMLAANELGAAPLFVLPETALDDQGLLPEDVAAPLHDWFAQLAADTGARAAVVRQTLDGALTALVPAVGQLAAAADDQAVAARALEERVRAAYRNALRTVEQGLQDGRLLRGEVLARWQEFVGTGEFLRTLESRVGRVRDRLVAAVTGRPAPGSNLQVALESQIVTLLRGVAADAAEQAYTGWQAHPAGAALLDPSLGRASADLPQRAERLVRDWQRSVLDLVRSEAGDKRFVARSAAYAVNATGLAVMIAVFTSTAFIPTGAELAVGAGTTVAAQKVLEAIFGDQAIRTLATKARTDLLARVGTLLDEEAARYAARTEAVGLDAEPGAELRKAAQAVERAREQLALTQHADLHLVDPA